MMDPNTQRLPLKHRVPSFLKSRTSDVITSLGRADFISTNELATYDMFLRASHMNNLPPIVASGAFTGASLPLQLQYNLVNASGNKPNVLIPGFVLSVSSSATVTPGDTTVQFSGFFEGYAVIGGAKSPNYNQTVTLTQSEVGNSHFYFLATDLQGGRTLAQPLTLGVVARYTSSTVFAALESMTLTATITAAPNNTVFTLTPLVPLTQYWDTALGYFLSNDVAAMRLGAADEEQ